MEQNKRISHKEEDIYILESCFICGKELTRTKDIFVDIEEDHYICKQCGSEHNIKIVPCMEL